MLILKFGNGSEELVREFEHKYGIVLDEEYRLSCEGQDKRYFYGQNARYMIQLSVQGDCRSGIMAEATD